MMFEVSRKLDSNDLRRKADQHWEMAGLARQDNDQVDVSRHTKLAREYEERIKELA